MDIKYSGFYVSGVTNNHIYFANYDVPSNLIESNLNISDTHHIYVRINKSKLINITTVDSPYIYSMNNKDSTIFEFKLSGNGRVIQKKITAAFSLYIPLSRTSFILRTNDTILKQNTIAKVFPQHPFIKYSSNALRKQLDGYFCTDGMLRYDRDAARVIYIYYYRNQIVCLDTNLNVLYSSKTIDTVNQAKIKVSELKSWNYFTMSAPPPTVNQKSCVYKGNIYIRSSLLADNENRQVFSKSSVIDVYDIKNGHYLYSFYIPDFGGYKVDDFQVLNKTLIAVQGHYFINYVL